MKGRDFWNRFLGDYDDDLGPRSRSAVPRSGLSMNL